MRWLRILVVGALAGTSALAADWIRLRTANFDLYTTYLENDARQTLEDFEQTRDFFLRVNAFSITFHSPLRIVAFRHERDYRPYSRGPLIPAYFAADEDGDYIVMSDLEDQRRRVAVHEYVHVLVRHSGLSIPLWLNEGLAEVYAGMETRDGKVLLGQIPRDRAYTLANSNWMRLTDLFRIGLDSSEYNEGDRQGVFYAQSCLLAHMLMLGDGWADKFSTFVEKVSASGDTAGALKETYGKSPGEIERAMNIYFRQPTVGGAAYRMTPRQVEIGPAQAVGEVEIGLVQAQILAMLGRPAEGIAQLERLRATHKESLEIEEALARLEWRKGDRDASIGHFQAILNRPGVDWKACWDYARLLDERGGDRGPELAALRKTLELNPDWWPARFMLGGRLFENNQPAEALDQFKQIRNPDPEHASSVYLAMALAALAIHQPQEAKQYAEQARKLARKPEESSRADLLLRNIGQPPNSGTEMRPAFESGDDPDRPVLRRRPKKPQ